MRRVILKKLLFIISCIIFIEITLRIGSYEPWQIYQPVFPNLPDDHEFDQELGWRNKSEQFVYPDFVGTGVITLTYSTDGSRLTSYKELDDARDTIWVVGDSFVQGVAISDHETFAWKLQEIMPNVKVINLAVSGYGTYQSLLMIEQHFARSPSSPNLVIYGFNDFHEMRNTASFIWLRGITINSTQSDLVTIPYATVENGQLKRHPPDKYAHWPLREHSSLITAFQDVYEGIRTWKRTSQETMVTRQILVEMDKIVQEHEARFLTVILSSEDQVKRDYISFFQQQGIDYLDCTHPEHDAPEMKVPIEGHPNGKMNTHWANCIMTYSIIMEIRDREKK